MTGNNYSNAEGICLVSCCCHRRQFTRISVSIGSLSEIEILGSLCDVSADVYLKSMIAKERVCVA